MDKNKGCCRSDQKNTPCCSEETAKLPAHSCDPAWKSATDMMEDVTGKIYTFMGEEFAEEYIHVCISEAFFNQAPSSELVNEAEEWGIYWALYHCVLDEEVSNMFGFDSLNQTPAQYYLSQNEDSLNSRQKEMIKLLCNSPFSFYEVVGGIPERTLDVVDVLTGEKITVKNNCGPEAVSIGSIFFASIVTFEGQNFVARASSTVFDPAMKQELLDVKGEWGKERLTKKDLLEKEYLARLVYLSMMGLEPPELEEAPHDEEEHAGGCGCSHQC